MAEPKTRRRAPSTTAGGLAVGTDQTAAVRLGAIAALHQPIAHHVPGSSVRGYELEPARDFMVCGECKVPARNTYDGPTRAPWPCATARLVGPWPLIDQEATRG